LQEELQAPGLASQGPATAQNAEFPQSTWDLIASSRMGWLSPRQGQRVDPQQLSDRLPAGEKRAILFRPA